MNRIKIDYGIDLGTTNSAICRMERGVPTICKIEVTDDTMPSCVFFNKKKSTIVGNSAYLSMKSDKRRATYGWHPESSNAFIEFKRTMGTNHVYESPNMGRGYSSEELSAEVLKALKSFVTDEEIKSVVITVPAKFTVNQKTATMEAARLAGFRHVELLQEPIAASLAYGLSFEQSNGHWMVFDFGGGTFDAALLRVENGIMQVFDTAGDNYLGGKNLDEAIVDDIIMPTLRENYALDNILDNPARKAVLRDALKTYAEDLKNQLSFKQQVDVLSNLGELGEDDNGEEIELDLTVKQEDAFRVMRPIFQRAVDICLELLKRNGMRGDELDKLIFVGGPTHSPLIRGMLVEQVSPRVDSSVDPMTAVATGAALYASTIDNKAAPNDTGTDVLHFDVGYESTSVERQEWVSIRLERENSGENCPDAVEVEFIRGDEAWSSGRVPVDAFGSVIECALRDGKPNSFAIRAFNEQGDVLRCFPEEITIIQGTKIGAAPLPYNIGISVWDNGRKKAVFQGLKGLEKNTPLPAVGVRNELRSTVTLRPGIDEDVLTIPVYQAEHKAEASLAVLHEYVADVSICGDEVFELIPSNSPVDVTLKVDSSEMMTMEVFFPRQDVTVSKKLDTLRHQSLQEAAGRIPEFLTTAREGISRLKKDGIDVKSLKEDLGQILKEYRESNEKKAVLEHVKNLMRRIEEVDSSQELNRLLREIEETRTKLHKAQKEFGDSTSAASLTYIEKEADAAIHSGNVPLVAKALESMNFLYFDLTKIQQAMIFIMSCSARYNLISWKDASRARYLIDSGLSMMKNFSSSCTLVSVAAELFHLMPEEEVKRTSVGLQF